MKIIALGCFIICLLATGTRGRPQITKLFPVQELVAYHQQVSDEVKPLDKFLGKLRATYDFVFRKPENTSNVERILARDSPDPDLESIKQIWTSQAKSNRRENGSIENFNEAAYPVQRISKLPVAPVPQEDWIEDVPPLSVLELQDQSVDRRDDEVETFTTPGTSLQLPTTLSRHLVEWLGSLLGLTYTIYAKLTRIVHVN